MKGGIIHLVETDVKLEDIRREVELPDGHKFDSLLVGIDVHSTVPIEHGPKAQAGKIAAERISEVKDTRIRDESIAEYSVEEKRVQTTDFLSVPGKFIAFTGRSGNFAAEVLQQHTEISITPANFYIDGFLERKNRENVEIDPWKIGFYGNHSSAENGVIHGSSLLSNNEIGDILDLAKKNQLGLDYEFEGNSVRMFAAESGYVEVYQPNDYTSEQFIRYVLDEILPHLEPA